MFQALQHYVHRQIETANRTITHNGFKLVLHPCRGGEKVAYRGELVGVVEPTFDAWVACLVIDGQRQPWCDFKSRDEGLSYITGNLTDNL